MTVMPDDVRAKILSLFPDRRSPAATTAQSIQERGATTAAVVAGVRAASPALGDALDRIMAVPQPEALIPPDRDAVDREMRSTAVALRIVTYRREIVRLGVFLVDQPTDAAAGARIGDLSRAVRELEQRFPSAATLAHRELQREKESHR